MLFKSFKKFAAVALAATVCVSTFSTQVSAEETKLETSFDVYSPVLVVNVPVRADIRVNAFADSTATDTTKFTVASGSLDFWNATIDLDEDKGIPVNVTVKAAISKKGEGVITEYNDFGASLTSNVKKVNLKLSEAKTAAELELGKDPSDTTGATTLTPVYTDGKLDFSAFTTKTVADYSALTNSVSITEWGSVLSLDIAAPSSKEAAGSYADAEDVTPTVGSFAVTGTANAGADWKADDIAVDITYNVRASQPLSFTTPAVTTAPTYTAGSSAADVSMEIKNVGDATVVGVVLHDDILLEGEDIILEGAEVTYAADASDSKKTNATIKLAKEDDILVALGEIDTTKTAHDIAIVLSDGRVVTTTLTVN